MRYKFAYMNIATNTIDMKPQSNVVLPAAVYEIAISVSNQFQIEIPLKAGWNMVSVPVMPQDTSVNSVFPGNQAVYRWNPSTMSYVTVSNVQPQKSYWVALLSDTTYTVTGVPVYEWTTNITAGWNMIGSVMSNAGFTSPNDDPDGSVEAFIYWWDPVANYYVFGTAIEAGKGYWIAATQNCDLTMP